MARRARLATVAVCAMSCSLCAEGFLSGRPVQGVRSLQQAVRAPSRCCTSMTAGDDAWRREVEAAPASAAASDVDSLLSDEPIRLPEIVVPELLLSPVERIALWRELRLAEPKLQSLIDAEDFSSAAELRERITTLKAQDPYFAMRDEYEGALVREDYMRAAKLKMQMDKLGAPPGMVQKPGKYSAQQPAAAAADTAQAARNAMKGISRDGKTTTYSSKSDTTTNGVRIEVRSQYYPGQSNPEKDQYFFIYKVKITNGSADTVQLVSRKWKITSQHPQTGKPVFQDVQGPGVVGQQPCLEPGQFFEYSSACPLFHGPKDDLRVLGKMEGSYLMVTGAVGQQGFEASISPFYLILPKDLVPLRNDSNNKSNQ